MINLNIGAQGGAPPRNDPPGPVAPARDPFVDPIQIYDNPEHIIEGTDWELISPVIPLPWWWLVVLMAPMFVFGWWYWALWIGACVVLGLGLGRRYHYAGRFHHGHVNDLRPDANALLELRHVPRYGMIEVRRFVDWWGLRPPLADALWLPWGGVCKTLYVSFEMVSQLATDTNMSLAVTEEVAWLKMNAASRALHPVNYDRFLSLAGINVKQDTVQYVFALYKRMLCNLVEDFPTPVSQQ